MMLPDRFDLAPYSFTVRDVTTELFGSRVTGTKDLTYMTLLGEGDSPVSYSCLYSSEI